MKQGPRKSLQWCFSMGGLRVSEVSYTGAPKDHMYMHTYIHICRYRGVVLNSLFPKWPTSRAPKILSRNFRRTIAVHDSDNKLI